MFHRTYGCKEKIFFASGMKRDIHEYVKKKLHVSNIQS
jgi:hypothetical protein